MGFAEVLSQVDSDPGPDHASRCFARDRYVEGGGCSIL
jgi:hypothetical protein